MSKFVFFCALLSRINVRNLTWHRLDDEKGKNLEVFEELDGVMCDVCMIGKRERLCALLLQTAQALGHDACDVLFVVGFFRLLCSYGSTHSGTNFTKEKKNKFDENFGF